MASRPMHVALVAGTRPELIKMAPVLLELRRRPDEFRATLIVTAQHREMLDQVAEAFDIVPDVDLDLMRPNQTLAELTARVVTGVQDTLASLKPDAVLVHGDTTTCLASALAAFYEGIPIGHVEAGLRTHDMSAPWPEEMNRRLTDPLCRWCFAPTKLPAENLRQEGVSGDRIFVTGNTVVDALHIAIAKVGEHPPSTPDVPDTVLAGRRLVLVTGHRRESFGEPLRALCAGLRAIADQHDDVVLVYPVHLNPNVAGPVEELLGGHERIRLIAPVGYLAMVHLLRRASLIVTDSGGIQEEAPSLGVPVMVTRRATERPEAIDQGFAYLTGCDSSAIVETARQILGRTGAREPHGERANPYGDGRAARRIADVLAPTVGPKARQEAPATGG